MSEILPVKLQLLHERALHRRHLKLAQQIYASTVLCFQEKTDQARYYDAQVMDIQRKLYDIRGCRCIFLIRYEHDALSVGWASSPMWNCLEKPKDV
ncbi:hypothetical protein L1887_06133 [Cichorium endivia]|nr:hypothetical protein L1887_06133 [Cichorium endivia]